MKLLRDYDAFILLDSVDGRKSEKDFTEDCDIVHLFKSQVEEVCPRIVSCEDFIFLAARKYTLQVCISIPTSLSFSGSYCICEFQVGGSFYPLFSDEPPSPPADLSIRGDDERETLSLRASLSR
ncbi:putative Peroxidase 48 isoform X2 [Ricinus communis]|uniref:putative Peroxidase 48 isoform X2 n=1 Tax=Ricinus communis TaxID=3988 RepID=UPI00201AEDE8|nr:putative Peroxidase 48 isoform X2 [Ricinus communis]